MLGIIGEISKDRPSLMAEWLNDFPDGDLRRNGLAKLAERWAGSDPVRAAEWAAGLPAEQSTPAVRSAVAQGLFAIDPAVSVQWLQAVGDGGARLDALTQILSRHDDAGRIIDTLAPELTQMLPSAP